jgi:type IV secretory pathway component VirB8
VLLPFLRAVIALLIVAALLPVKASTTYFVTFQSRDGRLRSICRFEGFEFADE